MSIGELPEDWRDEFVRIGGLFEGYGGLTMGVRSVLGGDLAWYSEIDPAASRVLAHHHPDVPNLGDITAVDWTTVEPIDVLTGGFPCQDISNAGKREGIAGARSGLWSHYADAIRLLRPRYVVIENVGALIVRGLDRVLTDLAALGFDAEWTTVRASSVGAPHRRERVFIVAQDTHGAARSERRIAAPGQAESRRAWPDAGRPGGAPAADADGQREHQPAGGISDIGAGPSISRSGHAPADYDKWGDFAPAIHRWEHIVGRSSPVPTVAGQRAQRVLNPAFVEWMMGLPAGHVTAVEGLSRNDMLKILGNGVVPHQAAAAVRSLLPLLSTAERAA